MPWLTLDWSEFCFDGVEVELYEYVHMLFWSESRIEKFAPGRLIEQSSWQIDVFALDYSF